MDTCVLFLHHLDDDITRRHFDLICQHNPLAAVVPLCWQGSSHLQESIEVALPSMDEGPRPLWRNCDRMIYNWFQSINRINADRYIIIEWDTLVSQPFSEFYSPAAWNSRFAAAFVHRPQEIPDPYWWWYELSDFQWQALGPFIRGLIPISGVLIERLLLESMSEASKLSVFSGIFCEARIATLAAYCGVEPIELRPNAAAWIQSKDVTPKGPGVWHRVRK